jgi:hypothetical protein
MAQTLTIKVYEIIGGPDAISTDDGQAVFERIDKAFVEEMKVILDFQNIDLIISTFLNAAVGQLYGSYSEVFIPEHIGVANMTSEDQNLLRIVTRRAKEYFKNQKEMDIVISNTLGDDLES